MSVDRLERWAEAGARAAATLGADAGALVVLGTDVEATASAALGLARALAVVRQVALADLLGESETLAALVDDPAAPGIADSFVHGESLNRVARPVPGEDRLFILPSGGIEAAAPDIMASTRWDRLARGFRQVEAQLIVVAHAGEPEAEGLARRLGGAVVVGLDTVLGPDVHTVATVLAPPAAPAAPVAAAPPVAPSAPAAPSGPAAAAGPTAERELPDALIARPSAEYRLPGAPGAGAAAAPPSAPDRGRTGLLVGLLLIVAGTAAVAWSRLAPRATAAGAAASPAAAAPIAPPVDTVPLDTTGLVVENPGDSAAAAGYAVELLAANTLGGAILSVGDSLPAGTVAPALLGPSRARWFRVVAGAFATRREADSLLAALVQRRVATEGAARVITAPLAFRLEVDVAPEASPLALARWKRTGLPAYMLVQDGGKVTIFAGAFERLEQAALLAGALRAQGQAPHLVYRTGRTF
jgi:hypothetical protein